MITLKEIAQMCGVSTSTVSNIMNGRPKVSEETKQRVLDVIRDTGYQPNFFAQGIRKTKTNIIGIITEDLVEFSTLPIIETMMQCCEERGYRTILINMRLYDKWQDAWYDDEEKYQSVLQPALQELTSIKVDGIIYVAGHCRIINCFPENFAIPSVMAYGISKNETIPSIVLNDEKGGFTMTDYLLSMGHKKIGVIAGVEENIHTTKRLLGYQKALFHHGLSFQPSYVLYGNWSRKSGTDATEELLKRGVTALFCMNDVMAAGVYDYCYEHNLKIREDISVVGYDNQLISEYLRPKLTTSKICLKEIATKSAGILFHILDSSDTPSVIPRLLELDCTLVVRDSVTKI